MLKKCVLLFGVFSLFTITGVAQENGWTTLTVGQSVYGIRYDQHGAVIVNNVVVMGCAPIPESYDITLNVSRPSPLKKFVLILCSRGDDGDEAYIIDTVRNRVVSRDVVPKHWRIINWISWSPDERFALVAAAGEVTNGDMAFVDLQTGRVEEIHFKTFTNNPQIKQDIMGEIQDFDPDGISWINAKSFRLRLDVHCNPYQLGDELCDHEKVLRSHAAQVNLSPFSIAYGNSGQPRSTRARTSETNRHRANVGTNEATFVFPLKPNQRYEWSNGGRTYMWSVAVNNNRRNYEFGFYLDTPMGATPEESGDVHALLQAGQCSMWKIGRDSSGSIVESAAVECFVSEDQRLMTVKLSNENSIKLLFSSRPKFVTFKIQLELFAKPLSVRVPVKYS